MQLLRFLIQSSRRMTLLIALVGGLSGALSAALLALINRAVHNEAPALVVAAVVAVSIAKIVSGLWARWLVLQFGQDTVLRLITDLSRRVLRAPYRRLETLGTHRVLTALTTDVQVLGAAVLKLPDLAINGAIVIGSWAYLAWLSPVGLAALTVCVLVGVGVYRVLHATAFQAIFSARQERDRLMSTLRSLTDGIKELKINRARKDDFLANDVSSTARSLRTFNLAAARRYMVMDGWNQALFYLLIAGVLFFFPMLDAGEPEILTGYIFASLYVMTPIWSIMGAIPTLANGQASLTKLDELGIVFDDEAGQEAVVPDAAAPVERPTIAMRALSFSYGAPDDEEPEFSVGPVDFELRPGELVFIVGGNGSGKSTFVKLLCGLYTADSGTLTIDGTPVGAENIDWYRQHFSVVFSDFYLFERLLGQLPEGADRAVGDYLRELELDHKVSIEGGRFSTTALSQGQRRRLALLGALMEDRPVHIFDEWAADQDPQYKAVFYNKLLPQLRANGKSVVVVTHDDRYFHMGDRVIKLADGRIASITRGERERSEPARGTATAVGAGAAGQPATSG